MMLMRTFWLDDILVMIRDGEKVVGLALDLREF